MIPVAPRVVNDVVYLTDIIHESLFARKVQYLVILGNEFYYSGHYI